MRIACCLRVPEAEAQAWLAAFRAALPNAQVDLWRPGSPAGDYAVVWRPTQECVDAHARAKAIFNAGAGLDALLSLKLPEGVPIYRLEDAGMGRQMAEYVTYAVLRHFREFDAYEQQARERTWKSRPPRIKADYAVGILGIGVLGQVIARTLQSLGFPVRGWSRRPKSLEGIEVLDGRQRLEEFLRGSRILVCVLPLTSETRGILDRHTFAALPAGAYVINVARGGLIVEDDLLDALDRGALSGAFLDVTEREPLPPEHAFWSHPRVTLTPHCSAQTLIEPSVDQIASKIALIERGETPSGRLDPRRGY